MIKVHVLEGEGSYAMETKVNNWIIRHSSYEIYDIKYSIMHPQYGGPKHCAMIIYKI